MADKRVRSALKPSLPRLYADVYTAAWIPAVIFPRRKLRTAQREREYPVCSTMFSKRPQVVPQPPVYMIHKMFRFGNILSQNCIVNKKQYDTQIESLDRFQVECGDCHRRGCCIKHGFYERNYLISPAYRDKIQILRMLCKACGSTHAILPEEIVPYAQYSIIFMFLVLYQYYIERSKVEDICDQFGIVPAVLYRWKRTFKRHKDRYLGILESGKYTESETLALLRDLPNYAQDLAGAFIAKTERMPMQTHRNPPNTRRPVLA